MLDLQRGSPDDQFIFVNDSDELRHWAKKLGVTPEALKAAIGLVGNCAADVQRHLREQANGRAGRAK